MNKIFLRFLLSSYIFLTACSPIKTPVSNQYKFSAYSTNRLAANKTTFSILVSEPDAIAGYQTEQMLYINKPFQLNSYAHNSWISAPGSMLYPLIVQSLQHSNFFFAVASGPNSEKTNYRLDTQLLALQQNFLTCPSRLELVVQSVLTHIEDNRVVASRTFREFVNCPKDTPYGGVVAANKATLAFTKALTQFVIDEVKKDERTTH